MNGHAYGGFRMHSKLTIDKLKLLARSMTMKSGNNKGIKKILYQSTLEMFNRGLFPKFIIKLFAPLYLKKTMLKDKTFAEYSFCEVKRSEMSVE